LKIPAGMIPVRLEKGYGKPVALAMLNRLIIYVAGLVLQWKVGFVIPS